ncbi:hypothetical protein AAG906_030935 [Vitis piasezkii]
MTVVTQILSYLKGTLRKGIIFSKNGHLETTGYTDADCVGNISDRKSTSEIGFPSSCEMNLLCDNKATIDIAHNLHVEVYQYFIKQNLEAKIIWFPFVKSEDQLANIFTKVVCNKVFHNSQDKLGINDIYAPT